MKHILKNYLRRTFVFQTLFAVCALAGIVEMLDLLDNATEILQRHLGLHGIIIYFALRLPTIIDQVLAIGVLIGVILTFTNMARHNEITVLRAAGVTTYKMLMLLMPTVLAITLFQFLLKDQIAPRTERALSIWWQATQLDDEETDINPVWFRVGPYIVSAAHVSTHGRHMEDVTIYQRDNRSLLSRRILAKHADEHSGQWTLRHAVETNLIDDAVTIEPPRDMVWDVTLTPQNLLQLSAPNARLSITTALAALNGSTASSQARSYYQMQIYQTCFLPFASVIMLLLGLPSAFSQNRDTSSTRLPLVCLAIGLLFILITGILSSFGQTNTLPPLLAISSSFIFFGILGTRLLIRYEENS